MSRVCGRVRARGSQPIPILDQQPAVESRSAHPGGWRAEVAVWARAILGGTKLPAPALDALVSTGIRHDLAPALALLALRGTHARSRDRVAARGCLRDRMAWAELLGHGRLVLAGFIRSTATGSIELTEQTIAALDATDEAPRSRDERSAHVGEDLSDARTAIA